MKTYTIEEMIDASDRAFDNYINVLQRAMRNAQSQSVKDAYMSEASRYIEIKRANGEALNSLRGKK